MEYLQRCSDRELAFRLKNAGAVLITGPKWCGKTTTGRQQAKSVIEMQDPDRRESYLNTAQVKPSLLLRGETPRLIDEWQDAPVLWDAVRTAVDRSGQKGLFILTGSLSVDSSRIQHSGTGRISRMKMYPMSLYESRESNGRISLADLFENPQLDIDGIECSLSIEELIFAACRGGWPQSLSGADDSAKLFPAKDYYSGICEADAQKIDGKKYNPRWLDLILRSYARNISTLAKITNIQKDIAQDAGSISIDTINSYIEALERLFVIEDIDAWCPAIRSATAIRSGKKRAFVDPSIAVAAMRLSPDYFYTDLKTFGFLFECLCVRDLRIYSQRLEGRISYYHDRYDLEADAVLHLGDGRYALIEFKLGSRQIEEGAAHLLEIRRLVREFNSRERQCPLREPDLLIVMTGGAMAYTRPDGVKVVPVGCLKD